MSRRFPYNAFAVADRLEICARKDPARWPLASSTCLSFHIYPSTIFNNMQLRYLHDTPLRLKKKKGPLEVLGVMDHHLTAKPVVTAYVNSKRAASETSLHDRVEHASVYLRYVVDDATDASRTQIAGPFPTKEVLKMLDPSVHVLKIIALPREDWPLEPFPICRIRSRRLQEAENKLAREAERVVSKTVEISWAIDPHDLAHKCRIVEQFLDKGYRVEVILARRQRGQKKVDMEQAQELIRQVEELMVAKDAVKIKPSEGQVLRTLSMQYQGKKVEEKHDSCAGADAGEADEEGEMAQELSRAEKRLLKGKRRAEKLEAKKRSAEGLSAESAKPVQKDTPREETPVTLLPDHSKNTEKAFEEGVRTLISQLERPLPIRTIDQF